MTWFRITVFILILSLILLGFFGRAGRESTYLSDNFFDSYSEMEEIAHSLNTDCSTCHTFGKLWLTEKGEIARTMMKYSVDLNLKCQDCHNSIDTYTETGKFAKKWMFPMVEQFQVNCLTCHNSSTNNFTKKGRKARVMLDYSLTKKYDCAKCHKKGSTLNSDDLEDFGVDEMANDDFPDLSLKGLAEFEKLHHIDSLVTIKKQ